MHPWQRTLSFTVSVLLVGCAGPLMKAHTLPKLVPGTPEANIIREAGAPESTVTHADGTRSLIYTTQPGGTQCFLVRLDSEGKLMSVEDTLSDTGRAKIERGMTKQAVMERMCQPMERLMTRHPYEVLSWNMDPFAVGQPRYFDVIISEGRVRHTQVRTSRWEAGN